MDTNNCATYSINEQACAVIERKLQDDQFWETLLSMDLAISTTNNILVNDTLSNLPERDSKDKLRFVWFEVVSDKCNQWCVHCYAGSSPNNSSSGQDTRDNNENKNICDNQDHPRMTYSNWIDVINECYKLGCRSCQFIGGEPLLYIGDNKESIFGLIEEAKKIGYTSIELFTNCTMLTTGKIKELKRLGVKVATSLYSYDPLIHDSITRTPGSHRKLIESLSSLQKHNVPTRVEIVLMSLNQTSIEATIDFRRKLGCQGRSPDPLRPSGRGENKFLLPNDYYFVKYGVILNPKFSSNREKIKRNRSGNPCLNGKITITEYGDVLPCIFSRTKVVGNFFTTRSLKRIISNNILQEIWHSTKENVLVCRDCEYRYLCSDCRPLSETASEGRSDFFRAPYPRCTYNPYTGTWGEGLWKMDDSGCPIYDTGLNQILHDKTSKNSKSQD